MSNRASLRLRPFFGFYFLASLHALPSSWVKKVLRTTPAVRGAPCRRPPRWAGHTRVHRRVREQAVHGDLVPARVTGQMEVGHRRWLVEEEVGEGDLAFLLVLHHGPVYERDEAFHLKNLQKLSFLWGAGLKGMKEGRSK